MLAPATSAWSPARASPTSAMRSSIRDVVPERIERLAAGEIPIYEPGLDKVLERNADRSRSRSMSRTGRRRRLPLRRGRDAADRVRRRRSPRRMVGHRRAAGRPAGTADRRHEEHGARRHRRARPRAPRRARADQRRLCLESGVPGGGKRGRRLQEPRPDRRRRVRAGGRGARRRAPHGHRRPRSCARTSRRPSS